MQFASERLRSHSAQVLRARVQADVEQATTFMQEVSRWMRLPPLFRFSNFSLHYFDFFGLGAVCPDDLVEFMVSKILDAF